MGGSQRAAWSTAVSVASMAGRPTSMHGWHTYGAQRGGGVAVEVSCPAGGEVGSWENTTVHRQVPKADESPGGALPIWQPSPCAWEPEVPTRQLQWAGPRLPLARAQVQVQVRVLAHQVPIPVPVPRPTLPHLTHRPPADHFFLQTSPPVILRHCPSRLPGARLARLWFPWREPWWKPRHRSRSHTPKTTRIIHTLLSAARPSHSQSPSMPPPRLLAIRPLTRPSPPAAPAAVGPAARPPRTRRHQRRATPVLCTMSCARQLACAIFLRHLRTHVRVHCSLPPGCRALLCSEVAHARSHTTPALRLPTFIIMTNHSG